MDEGIANPYAVPQGPVAAETDAVTGELEAIRRKHLNTEVTIKQLGLLSIIGGAFMTVGAIAGLLAARIPSPGFLIALVVAGLSLYGGRELRRLTPRGRLIQTVLMAFFTLGAFLNPAVLFWDLIIVWALWSTQGRVVFGAHYREVVIPATPEVKYRPSILIWAGGIAIVLLVGLLIAGLVAERFHH